MSSYTGVASGLWSFYSAVTNRSCFLLVIRILPVKASGSILYEKGGCVKWKKIQEGEDEMAGIRKMWYLITFFIIIIIKSFCTTGGEERFDVDTETGVILTTGLPLTPDQEYVVTVLASDEYGNKSPYVFISILAGTRPPQFTNTSYGVFVPENTPANEK